LFSSHNNNNNNINNKHKKSSGSTASEAQRIQQSLMKTQSLLKNELHRVTHLTNAIDDDERLLRETMNEHKSLNTKQASRALTSLQRAQRHEQNVLYVSVLLYVVVVFYILWSRVLIKFDFVSIVLDYIV
jgi:flagellar biosynthesis chaperone FliJ